MPRADRPYPCVVIVGGTLSELRDGELDQQGFPQRTALKRLAESLAGAGYGSFRYDQVGHGESRAEEGWTDLYEGDARVLSDICTYLRSRSECTKVIAAAESAGAYVASLAARAGVHADAYLFLGGFCGKAEEIFSCNFGSLAAYVEKDMEHAGWAKASQLDRELAFGRRWREMFAAARAGKDRFEVLDGTYRQTVKLARRREELDNPPDEMFAYIKQPALALAGTRDLNVAAHHGACAVAVMHRAGNLRARSVLIEGADHSFQIAPDDADLAFRERYTFASFNRPYHPDLDREILAWLREVAPAHGHKHDAGHPAGPAHGEAYSHAVQASGIEPKTATSPERLHLAPGVTIIDDILDRQKTVGVDTLEGFIGPLLRTPEMRTHFIDMPAGLYLDEHPHAKGSIIYTVRGTWALKSLGRWHLMKPGSLYWFGDNIPTGFQVPFPEDAYILIFKAVSGDGDEAFTRYLQGMAANLRKAQDTGTVFRLVDLAPSDPALDFARKANPRFDRDFPAKPEQTNTLQLEPIRSTQRPVPDATTCRT
ncbi:MAG: alpha/beta fold hydrolase [Bryobacterales bacterium]|nr:alpha/beta fold hydrolase [Bryobacterales bacterium]